MRYVGLDLSLTSTGVALLDDGVAPQLAVATSKPSGTGLAARHDRLTKLVNQLEALVQAFPEETSLAVEAPTYATNSGHQHDRSGMWWLVVDRFIEIGVPLVAVAPTTLKLFASGTGSASKGMMTAVTARVFPDIPISDFRQDDKPDALWLALLCQYLDDPEGGRIERTKYRDKAVSAVERR